MVIAQSAQLTTFQKIQILPHLRHQMSVCEKGSRFSRKMFTKVQQVGAATVIYGPHSICYGF